MPKMSPQDEAAMPAIKRVRLWQAEIDARMAALEGGDSFEKHLPHIKWLEAAIYDAEQEGKRR